MVCMGSTMNNDLNIKVSSCNALGCGSISAHMTLGIVGARGSLVDGLWPAKMLHCTGLDCLLFFIK